MAGVLPKFLISLVTNSVLTRNSPEPSLAHRARASPLVSTVTIGRLTASLISLPRCDSRQLRKLITQPTQLIRSANKLMPIGTHFTVSDLMLGVFLFSISTPSQNNSVVRK